MMYLIMASSQEDYEAEEIWPVALYHDEHTANSLCAQYNEILRNMYNIFEFNKDRKEYDSLFQQLVTFDPKWKDREDEPSLSMYTCRFWIEEVEVRG